MRPQFISEDAFTVMQQRVRGGVVGTREAKQVGRSPMKNISAEEMPVGLARLADSNSSPSPHAPILKNDGLIYEVIWRRHELNTQFPKVVMELEPC